ncbi:hypothetical protein VRU48_15400 [Pedobacter sp. KR3-3]|uniref:DUF4293 family protein n=1 Tax=Pedobacter albus TaxID=3113905 RepID=A0ABU7IAJ9_9SPHI|nr:hypothetical protein [Pedobacter sp. KR3-3]MEE1946510.1 hypothetical protein [Pedobacter sp. KR3-3]
MKHYKFLIAVVLLLLCITNIAWWFAITDRDISYEAMQATYVSVFPSFLQNLSLLTWLMFAVLVTAAVLFMQSRKEKSLKLIASSGMILSFVLAFWQLFSLM